MLAALGRAQLSRLDQMIGRRQAIRSAYVTALSGLPGLRVLGSDGVTLTRQDNCWLTCVEIDPDSAVMTAGDLIEKLGAEDIEARRLWKPMHLQPVFRGERAFVTGVAERLFDNGVALPSGSGLTDDDVARVVDAVRTGLTP